MAKELTAERQRDGGKAVQKLFPPRLQTEHRHLTDQIHDENKALEEFPTSFDPYDVPKDREGSVAFRPEAGRALSAFVWHLIIPALFDFLHPSMRCQWLSLLHNKCVMLLMSSVNSAQLCLTITPLFELLPRD